MNNYQNKYDRIRGIIENNRVKGINIIEGLNNRKKSNFLEHLQLMELQVNLMIITKKFNYKKKEVLKSLGA